MDRRVHLLGILSAHLATVGTVAGWSCPEKPVMQPWPGPDISQQPQRTPHTQTCCVTVLKMSTPSKETSSTGVGGGGGVVRLDEGTQADLGLV